MKKITLIFLFLALGALFFADIEIISLNPTATLAAIARGLLWPDLSIIPTLGTVLFNTIAFALLGITLAFIAGSCLAPFYHLRSLRYFATAMRSVHEIFWAFLLLPVLGLTPLCGVVAIALPYTGIFAKRFAEIYQEADLRPYDALPRTISFLNRFFYGLLPLLWHEIAHYTRYRFECALRSSAVLGFIGLPTIGFHLESYFSQGHYHQAGALLLLFYLLILSLPWWMKKRLIAPYLITAILCIDTTVTFRLENIGRFLFRDIIPWPLRRTGVIEGTGNLSFDLQGLWLWGKELFITEILPGTVDTILLTQIALVGTGFFTLFLLLFCSRHLASVTTRTLSKGVLIVLRSTPEYIIAFVAIQIWGPSMLPGIIALLIHNGAVVAFLTLHSLNGLALPPDAPLRKIDRYFYTILPQIYGTFLANLFYRWEVMIRESALLGILGIYTLGFYVDSAFSELKMDRALLLILSIALLNIAVDTLSQRLRRSLRQ